MLEQALPQNDACNVAPSRLGVCEHRVKSTTMAVPVEPNSTPMRTANRARFELELEFVQALANPFYLENLASEGLLEDQAFINYIQYLQYWRKSEYARFIVYPHCLHFLELLQHEQFRNELKNPVTRMRLEHYQFEHWRTWRSGPPPPTEEQQPQAADDAKTPGPVNPSTTPGPGRNSATPGPGRGSATPAVSRRGSLHPGASVPTTGLNGAPA
ncbi:unnamed protein product [Rhizoctonia solani]|uniref:Mediator of RNA polymerase II transcription subunit 31 n=1 Tax=Rhizoctonia solani TaxID=456999 RepID=A0A8H3HNW9_9AGAM|nr:unnamed protein product [Rhizoctonia solani]